MTSCIDWPRTASGDCSPIAHSTASVMLDLPEPLGPTMTDTPSPNSSFVRSGKDLKPFRVSDFRCTPTWWRVPRTFGAEAWTVRPYAGLSAAASGSSDSSATRAASCSACFLERPEPVPRTLPSTAGGDLEGAVVRRAALGGHLVGDDLAALRQALLQRRLVVDGMLQRVLQLRREGLDDRRGRALVARVQEARADHRLDDRRQHALGLHQRGRLLGALGRRGAQPLGHAETLGDVAAGRPGDRLRADLRQPAGAVALGLQQRVDVRGDREAQHAVAQERQARVGVRPPRGPRGVGEDLAGQVRGNLVEECVQLLQRTRILI